MEENCLFNIFIIINLDNDIELIFSVSAPMKSFYLSKVYGITLVSLSYFTSIIHVICICYMYNTCIPHIDYPHQSTTQTTNTQHLKTSIKNISFHNLCLEDLSCKV